jgi:hypothetical protein
MEPTRKRKFLGRYALVGRFRELFYKTSSNKPGPSKGQKQANELANVANNAQDILLEANSVFPFNFFPDTIKIDREKLIIIERTFFMVAKVKNIQLHDIQTIEADVGPFFGSLSITTKQNFNTVFRIHFLTRKDAMDAQKIIQGFVIAIQKELEYSNISTSELKELLESLGQGESA